MKSKEQEKNRSKRRTAETIEEAVFSATERLVQKKGFSNVAITEIMKEAKVDPTVMYKRFDGLLSLYDKFIRQYDYWLQDIVGFDQKKDPIDQVMKDILMGLIDSLEDNPVMQKILLWELAEQNHITKRMSINRELQSETILDFFNKRIDDSKVDFNTLAAILIGGIYYLILHKDISTFCNRDFNKKQDKQTLKETINYIIEIIYGSQSMITPENKLIASLVSNGVDPKVIALSSGLTEESIREISNPV